MCCVGIWETGEALTNAVGELLSTRGIQVLCGDHPAPLSASPLDLLAVGPVAKGWAGAGAIRCPMVLLPGTAGPLARCLRAGCVVSYGTDHRDTLTFSSLEGAQIGLAVQRELVTLEGCVVERQELPLPLPEGFSPQLLLAAAGVLLLTGVPPETLGRVLTSAPAVTRQRPPAPAPYTE